MWTLVFRHQLLGSVFLLIGIHALDVQGIVPQPWLGPQGLPVLGRPFALECIVLDPAPKSYRDLSINWYRDSRLIKANSYFILRFPHLTREDRGVYTCTASTGNARTTSIDSNELDVLVLLPPVVHIEPSSPDHVIRASVGDNLTLTCHMTEALPWPDRYVWSYLPSPQGQLRPLEGRESTLTLGPLTREDRGQYFCWAWNDRGFEGEIPPGNASVTLDVLFLGRIDLTSDLEADEGDYVTLTCEVDCNPDAHLVWYHGGLEVRHVTANVDHYVLESAACSDSKTYTCLASNPDLPGLERKASTQVVVNCSKPGEKADAEEFHANATEVFTSDDRSATLKIALLSTLIPSIVIGLIIVGLMIFRRRYKQLLSRRSEKTLEGKPRPFQSYGSFCLCRHTEDDRGTEEQQSMTSQA